MAEEEAAAPSSIADRIAALKLSQVGRVPSQQSTTPSNGRATTTTTTASNGLKPKPPPPPRPDLPARPNRTQSSNVPTAQTRASVANGSGIGNQPEEAQPNGAAVNAEVRPTLPARTPTQSSLTASNPTLPPRRPSAQFTTPALPPRRPSEAPSQTDYDYGRRPSSESVSSVLTASSSISAISTATSQSDRFRIKAPEYDSASLPPLPPRRTKEEKDADARKYAGLRPLRQSKSSPKVDQVGKTTTAPPSRPTVVPPPALPQRPNQSQEQPFVAELPATAARRVSEAPPKLRQSALGLGLSQSTNRPNPGFSERSGSVPQIESAAPPVPTTSKPDLAALQASKPKPNGASTAASAPLGACLHCRDFSGPDNHAARFPRQSIPSADIGWLAEQLTSPFPSATDKARAIFTWLHHNIEYDVAAFFGNRVKPSTPQSTLQTGLAVCEGYAGLFTSLAVKAGLESVVVGGHGKGYGYSALQPGDPLPQYSAGHAWNTVRIDQGDWKLIDACWGAGVVGGANQPYQKRFSPERFTQSNNDFGMDHYPGDTTQQFRTDGRTMSWEEYITGNKNGCGADFFSGFVSEEGLSNRTFQPTSGKIVPSQQGPTVRFSFQKICPHWDPVRCGPGPYYVYILHLEALDGTDRNHIPFDTNGDVWWCDVPVRDLGRAGQKAEIFVVTSFGGKDGRGLTVQEYRRRKGTVGMAFGGVCKWEVA